MSEPRPTDRIFYECIGARIRNLRLSGKARPMSQYQLARRLGVSQNTVSRWESGEYRPTLLDALQIARFFGIPFYSPLFEDGNSDIDGEDYRLDGEISKGLPDLSKQDKREMLALMKAKRDGKYEEQHI